MTCWAVSRTKDFVEGLVLFLDVVEAGAVDQFHHDVGLAVFLAVAVDLDDVGVVDGGQGAGLLQELFDEDAVLADGLLHDLDGDGAAEGFVIGLVDGAHAALAELFEQDEVGETGGHAHFGAAGRAEDQGEGGGLGGVDRLGAFGAGDDVEPLDDDVACCVRCSWGAASIPDRARFPQQNQHQSLVHVHAVFGLVEDDGLGAIDDLGGLLHAAHGGQAVEEDGVGPACHQGGGDLVGAEDLPGVRRPCPWGCGSSSRNRYRRHRRRGRPRRHRG
jgi:hypothetical protein